MTTSFNLKAARLNQGLSVEALAEAIDVPVHVLRHAESGGTPRPGNALRIAEYFHRQVTDIWPVDSEPLEAA